MKKTSNFYSFFHFSRLFSIILFPLYGEDPPIEAEPPGALFHLKRVLLFSILIFWLPVCKPSPPSFFPKGKTEECGKEPPPPLSRYSPIPLFHVLSFFFSPEPSSIRQDRRTRKRAPSSLLFFSFFLLGRKLFPIVFLSFAFLSFPFRKRAEKMGKTRRKQAKKSVEIDFFTMRRKQPFRLLFPRAFFTPG